jgi:hypothetical protein
MSRLAAILAATDVRMSAAEVTQIRNGDSGDVERPNCARPGRSEAQGGTSAKPC